MSGLSKGTFCLNCEKLLHGENFCPNCGQQNNTKRLSFRSMIISAAAFLISSDSRLWKSALPLFFKPRKLAKEYISGKRTSIVPPLRLFVWLLIVSVAMSKLELAMSPEDTQSIKTTSHLDSEDKEDQFLKFNFNEDSEEGDTLSKEIYTREDIAEYALNSAMSPNAGLEKMKLEASFMNLWLYQIFQNVGSMTYTQFLRSILDNLLIVFLLFVPFFAVWMKLLYVRNTELYLVDHIVFILYNHSFLFLLYAILQLSSFFIQFDIISTVVIVYLLYLWLGFKEFYQQKLTKRIVKFIAAGIGFMLMSAIFTAISVGLAIYLI